MRGRFLGGSSWSAALSGSVGVVSSSYILNLCYNLFFPSKNLNWGAVDTCYLLGRHLDIRISRNREIQVTVQLLCLFCSDWKRCVAVSGLYLCFPPTEPRKVVPTACMHSHLACLHYLDI